MADKIDMSLDDIIKLNTSKRGSRGRSLRGRSLRGQGLRGQGLRGRGLRGRSLRGRRGFGRGAQSRGRGNWISKSSLTMKRGQGRSSALSRGFSRNFRSLSRPTSASKGISPLNRKTNNQKTNFKKILPQRARGLGRGTPSTRFSVGKRVLRGSRGGRVRIRGGSLRGSLRGRQGGIQQKQKQAIHALQKAKTTLSKINAQVRRHNFVAFKRGLPEQPPPQSGSLQRNSISSSWSNRSRMRGRGRSFQNRFIPSKLNRNVSNSLLSLKSNSSQQTVRQFGSTTSLNSQTRGRKRAQQTVRQFGSTTSLNSQTRGRKRAWRDNSVQRESPKIMTISVSNSTRGQNNRSSNMRPHIGTQNINFSSGIFDQGSTGVSLNDRFTSSEGSSSSVIVNSQERKVFF